MTLFVFSVLLYAQLYFLVYDARDVGEGIPIDAIRDLSLHSQRRKPWTRALAPKALKDYDELVKTKANVLVTKMTERVGQEVDLAAWSGYFGLVEFEMSSPESLTIMCTDTTSWAN